MSRRLVAVLLLLAAAFVWLLAGQPARRDRDRARADFARAREERQRQRSQLATLERQLAPPPPGPAGARALRRALLEATRGLSLQALGIDARADAKATARGHLSAEARTADAVELAGRLASAESGLALQRLEIVPAPDPPNVRVSAEVTSVGARR